MQIATRLIDVPAWFDVMTHEPDAARRFYGPMLGWEFELGAGAAGPYTWCTRRGLAVAGLGELPEDAEWPSMWNVYLGVTDIEATIAAVARFGGETYLGPLELGDAGRFAFCVDPTGTHFGVWQGLARPGLQVVDEPGSVLWCEIMTRDGARARDFYCAVFGLEAQRTEGVDYWTLSKGERIGFGIQQMNVRWPDSVPPHWLPYFGVPDVDLAASVTPALGGSIVVSPFDAPYGRMAMLADPSGAAFAILCPGAV